MLNGMMPTNFQYISAYRLGPQIQYLKEDKIIDIYKQISDIDGKAEYFVARTSKVGEPLANHLAQFIEAALKKLPVAKVMRWGNGEAALALTIKIGSGDGCGAWLGNGVGPAR